jgi:exopolysaccharide biosynthesis polyprenyl glycosylphosphotransferase
LWLLVSVLDHRVATAEGLPAPAALDRPTPYGLRGAATKELVQFALISLIVLVVLGASEFSTALVAQTVLAATIWFVAGHAVYTNNRWLSPLVIGTTIVSTAGAALGLAGVAAAATLISAFDVDAPQLLVMACGIAVATSVFEIVADRRLWPRRRLLIVGTELGGLDLMVELQAHAELGFDCIGVVDDTADEQWRFRGVSEDLRALIEQERPDLVVLAGVGDRDRAIEQLLDAAACPFRLVEIHHFYEHAFGRVPLRNLSPGWFMSVLHLYRQRYPRFSKRAIDICVGTCGLLVLAPLFPLLALLVRSSGPGPVLFRQTRLGESGKPFQILKFRTMVLDAEPDGAIWAAEDDPRITSAGRVLRRTRLDELPQLWNVLVGEMSIVGPRPERPEFLEQLAGEVPFWTRRHLVKPGITGWAQLQRGYTTDALGAAEKLSYDLYYLKHRSLLLDLAIIARTAVTVVTGSGAH